MPVRLRTDRGATAVEVALVLPLVLGLIGMVIMIGWGMGIRALLLRGVESGARAGAVIQVIGETDAEQRYLTAEEIQDRVRGSTVLLDTAALDVSEPVWLDESRGEGSRFTITATYTWNNPAAGLVAPLVGVDTAGEGLVFQAQATRIRE